MGYKALYRTYRPSTFDEVAGQQHIVKTLQNAFASGKIAHAYLFTGPRGTGKTTMAKLFAKALNCNEGMGKQCNSCENCVSINEGQHPDVIEIDAASNRGINEIRDLIEKVKYAPILGKYKVYIIDEVHMMTPEAFNALLKTLEEPPEKVVFILATTEPHKVLPTILSRCQRYDFGKVRDEDILERVKIILEKENITYNEEAVKLIISLADGGVRDTLSMLDQVLAYSGDKLDVNDVLDIFSLESKEEKIALLYSIANGNVSDVLVRLNKYITKGTDIKRLTNDLLKMLKDLLIYIYTHTDEFFEMLTKEDAESLRLLGPKRINNMIDILLNAIKEYKNVSDINPLFEVTLLKLTSTNSQEEISIPETKEPVIKITKDDNNENDVTLEVEPIVKQEVINNPEPTIVTASIGEDIEELDHILVLDNSKAGDNYKVDADTLIKIMVTAKKDIKNALLEDWKLLKKISSDPAIGKTASLLIDAHPLVASKDILILEFPTNRNVEKTNLISNQKEIQTIIYNTFKRKMFVYAVNRSESVELQTKYRNLLEISKLPKANEINLKISEE